MHKVVTTCLVLSLTGVAQAQSSQAHRRALVTQGVAASRRRDHAHALDLFTQAAAIQMRPELRLSIAYEHQDLGNLRLACEQASDCVADVQNPAESDRIAIGCVAVVHDACSGFGLLTLGVPSPIPEDLAVVIQGRPFDPTTGMMAAVDPGRVVVEATAAHGLTFRRELMVQTGTNHALTIALSAPSVETVPVVAAPVAVAPTATVHVTTRGPGAGPGVVMAVGVAGLITGAVFGLKVWPNAVDQNDPSQCNASGCSPNAQAAYNRGEWGTYLSLGIGSAAVVGGLLWYVLAPRTRETSTAFQWGVTPISGGMAATVGGRL